MVPWKKWWRGAMEEYGWMGRTSHLVNSGIMEKIRKIFELVGTNLRVHVQIVS